MLRRIQEAKGVKSLYVGLIYIVVGVVAFFWSRTYEIGTAFRMGPGYFPAMLGLILLGLGVISVVNGYRAQTPDPITKHRLEPFFLILASIVSFALLIERTGLIVAIFVSVLLCCARRAVTHPLEVFLTFVALAGFSALVFVHLFGMHLPLFWWN